MDSKRKFNFTLLALVTAYLLTGCATNKPIILTPQTTSKIDSTEVRLVLEQQEIYAEINRSNLTGAMGGGLLFALIDSAVDSSRSGDQEKSIQPIRDSLINFDTANTLKADYKNTLSSVSWLKPSEVKLERQLLDQTALNNITKSSDSSAVLFVNTKYFLSADLSTLKLTVNAEMRPKSSELIKIGTKNDPDQPLLYKNSYTYQYSLPYQDGGNETKIKQWTSKGQTNIATALKNGIASITKWLANDLNTIKASEQKLAKTSTL